MTKLTLFIVVFSFALNCLGQTNIPMATSSEIDEWNFILKKQRRIGILGGPTTRKVYYEHGEPNNLTYKYPRKVAGVWVDSWYPTSDTRTCACGYLRDFFETSDLKHTWIMKDRDFNFLIYPDDAFKYQLKNRWSSKSWTTIEGEVNTLDLDIAVFDPNKRFEDKNSTSNRIFDPNGVIKSDIYRNKFCMYGLWVCDCYGTPNNEIHPINQFWFRVGMNKTYITAVVDGSGWFDKQGVGSADSWQFPASGIGDEMWFYYGIIAKPNETQTYSINGQVYDNPAAALSSSDINDFEQTLTNGGKIIIKKVFGNSLKSYTVELDKLRLRGDNSIQGYILIKTCKLEKKRGSVTIIINDNGFSPIPPITPEQQKCIDLYSKRSKLKKELSISPKFPSIPEIVEELHISKGDAAKLRKELVKEIKEEDKKRKKELKKELESVEKEIKDSKCDTYDIKGLLEWYE